jgi:hypothetical protein
MNRNRAERRHSADKYRAKTRKIVESYNWDITRRSFGDEYTEKLKERCVRQMEKNRRACSCERCRKGRIKDYLYLDSVEEILDDV